MRREYYKFPSNSNHLHETSVSISTEVPWNRLSLNTRRRWRKGRGIAKKDRNPTTRRRLCCEEKLRTVQKDRKLQSPYRLYRYNRIPVIEQTRIPCEVTLKSLGKSQPFRDSQDPRLPSYSHISSPVFSSLECRSQHVTRVGAIGWQ